MRTFITSLIVVAMIMLVTFVGFTIPCPAWSQELNPDAELLYTMARNSWAPVELQAMGYFNLHIKPATCINRLRKSCLLLQAAQKLDNSNTAVLYDLFSILTSPAVNDPGRALDCLLTYSQLKPNDSFIVENWLDYQLDNMNNRKSREDFLRQSIPALQNYPYVLSQVQNQMGIMALEKGDTTGAINYFNQAFATSAFNDQALGRLLSVTMPIIKRNNINNQPLWQSASLQNWYQQNALHWRLRIRNNPYDISATLNFIQTLQISGHYNMAMQYYPYAFKLLKMSMASYTDIANLKLQQLSVAYSAGQYKTCLRIAAFLLKRNPNDLLVQTIKAMALQKLGHTAQAQKILQSAAAHALTKLKPQLTKITDKPQTKPQSKSQTKPQLKSQNDTPDNTPAKNRTKTQSPTRQNNPAQLAELAWFFCFAMPDPQRALQYSIASYQADHNNTQIRATLAYAQIMNQNYQQAQSLLKSLDPNDPLIALTRARLLAAQNKKAAARRVLNSLTQTQTGVLQENINQLYSTITTSPATQNNPQKPPAIQTTTPSATPSAPQKKSQIATSLPKPTPISKPTPTPASTKTVQGNARPPAPLSPFEQMEQFFAINFDNKDLQIVDHPQKFIKCYMKLSRDIYRVGEPIIAKIYLTNTSTMPLLIGQDSFLNPQIIVMAQLHPLSGSGTGVINNVSHPVDNTNTNKPFPATATLIPLLHRYIPSPYILPAGQVATTRVQLDINPIGKTLRNHPQKSYRITFYTFLDPVIDTAGNITTKISALQPKPVTITRIGFIPEPMRLNNRLQTMQSGSYREKINATKLIVSLLHEAQLARKNQLNYYPITVNTTPLQTALLACLDDTDYRVRAFAVHNLTGLDMLTSQPIINKLANLLNDKNWLVRFMTINTLEPVTDLTDYFKWALTTEKNSIVKRQIELLSHHPWKTKPITTKP